MAFQKTDVLERLGLTGVSAAIYWDYIRRRIEQGGSVPTQAKLLPVATAYFKKRRQKDTPINALLAGPGGKAAGFALATVEGGTIALASITIRVNQSNGAKHASQNDATLIARDLEAVNQTIAQAIRKKAGLIVPALEDGGEEGEGQ